MSAKLRDDMSFMEAITTMSEGCPGAMALVMCMIKGPKDLGNITLLDSLDIRGAHLYILNNDCCGRDHNIFRLTLEMFKCGVFSKEQIHANLEKCRALPFVDSSIRLEGVSLYSEDFGPTHPKWDEWCNAQKASFVRRFGE